MEIKITLTPTEAKELLQAITSSKEQLNVDKRINELENAVSKILALNLSNHS